MQRSDSIWSYSIEECDVTDKGRLREYRALADSCFEAMDGDALQSVSAQISDMMWQDAAWRSTNEARRSADKEQPTAAMSPLLCYLLDRGYISGQVLAISRLIEKPAPGKKGTMFNREKAVNSLRRVVDEVLANRALFTREIFVSHNGTVFDYWSIYSDYLQTTFPEVTPGSNPQAKWIDFGGPIQSMLRHQYFDKLSGAEPVQRYRDDPLHPHFFDRLAAVFDDEVFGHVSGMRNKIVAHAADTFSRNTFPDLRTGIKLDEFSRAHDLLISLYNVLSGFLFHWSTRGNAIPVPQYDQFEGLTSPFVTPDQLQRMYDFWRTHERARDQSTNALIKALTN